MECQWWVVGSRASIVRYFSRPGSTGMVVNGFWATLTKKAVVQGELVRAKRRDWLISELII